MLFTKKGQLYRHGDVLVQEVGNLPAKAIKRPDLVLAHGELTGHRHRIKEDRAAELFELNGVIYLRVIEEEATLVHEEHAPISLKRGTYKVWQQREYSPQAILKVID